MSNFDEVKLGSPPPYPGKPELPHENNGQTNLSTTNNQVPVYPNSYGSYPNATSTPIPPRNGGYPNPPPVQPAYIIESYGNGNQCYYVDGRRPRTYIVVSSNYRRRRAMYGGLGLL
uniref:Uncharacterized protein n=1 Tax=Acrobeloides nanus TaxID=290746 RepID=A0A914BZJ2_9BILA